MPKNILRGPLAVIIGAILMGTLPIFVRNLNLSSLQITFFRMLFGVIFISFLIFTLKDWRIKNLKLMLLYAAVSTGTIFSYVTAIQHMQVATAALLLGMAPVYVVVFVHFLGEKIQRNTLVALPFAIIGLVLLLSVYKIEGNVGLLFGLVSGVLYALDFIIAKRLRKSMSAPAITFYLLLFSMILLLPVVPSVNFASVNWMYALGLGLIPTALAFTIFFYGFRWCKTQQVGIFTLAEPLSASIFGFLLFAETLNAVQIIGALLILSSIGIISHKQKL